MKSIIVIPARLESTRLPRKLLLAKTGKSLIQHTYESASKSRLAERVIVAADDQRIVDEVERFGGQAKMTRSDHRCGTDRVAEVAAELDAEIVVNVQGDEPEIPGTAIDQAISILAGKPAATVATLATPIRDRKTLNDPSCVKVVFDCSGRAMYFSRSPIPWARQCDDRLLAAEPPNFYQHVGLYAYRRETLIELSQLAAVAMETIESLEQLRFLCSGFSIEVGVIDHPVVGIDTEDDYRAFVRRRANGYD